MLKQRVFIILCVVFISCTGYYFQKFEHSVFLSKLAFLGYYTQPPTEVLSFLNKDLDGFSVNDLQPKKHLCEKALIIFFNPRKIVWNPLFTFSEMAFARGLEDTSLAVVSHKIIYMDGTVLSRAYDQRTAASYKFSQSTPFSKERVLLFEFMLLHEMGHLLSVTPRISSEQLSNANEFIRKDDYDTAIKILKDALEQVPCSEEGLDTLAIAYRRSGQEETAINLYKKSAAANPLGMPDLFYEGRGVVSRTNLAFLLMSRGEFEKAENLYSEVYKIYPKNHEALYGLAIIAGRKKDYLKSLDFFIKCYEVTPQNDPIRIEVAFYIRSVASILGRGDIAEKYDSLLHDQCGSTSSLEECSGFVRK